MSVAFDEVKTVVARVRRRMGRADAARDRRADGRSTRRRRSRPGSASTAGATSTTRRAAVARLAASASADPLSTAPGDLDRLIDSLREIRRDLDAIGRAPARVRRAARRRPRPARDARDDGRRGTRRARGGAGQDRGPDGARTARAAAIDLAAELDEIAALARPGHGEMPGTGWTAWTSRTEALLDERAAARCAPAGRRSRRATSSEPCSRPTR